jgi:hypothetical protein
MSPGVISERESRRQAFQRELRSQGSDYEQPVVNNAPVAIAAILSSAFEESAYLRDLDILF